MAAARAEYVQRKGLRRTEMALSHNQYLSLAGSAFAPVSTAVMKLPPFQWMLEKVVGLDKRRGMPVEIIDEFGNWRQIRDWQGVTGWVHRSMLQGKRGVLVIGKERVLRDKPAGASNGVALVEAGVVGRLRRCENRWCLVEVQNHQGWLQRNEIYGLQPDEHF